jgi:hypothetical protein
MKVTCPPGFVHFEYDSDEGHDLRRAMEQARQGDPDTLRFGAALTRLTRYPKTPNQEGTRKQTSFGV